MDADLNALFAATLLFVGGHFALSSDALRPRLIDLMGERAFRVVYSVAILTAFVAMLDAENALFRNEGGNFRRIPESISGLTSTEQTSSACFADFDLERHPRVFR